jgi:hypothetical protein
MKPRNVAQAERLCCSSTTISAQQFQPLRVKLGDAVDD